MIDLAQGSFLPLIGLYVETHFRFLRVLPNLLFRSLPEVIFDMPRRLGPGLDLPIMLILNDIDRFPVVLHEVSFAITAPGITPLLYPIAASELTPIQHPFAPQSLVYLFYLPRKLLALGLIHVNCKAIIASGKNKYTVLNDNLPFASQAGYACTVSDEALPGSDSVLFGDCHTHSQFSQSHVEFGPPLTVIDAMANAYGLGFVGITDHSYDLQCSMSNYLQWDHSNTRWKTLSQDITSNSFKTVMLQGEEISCLNSRGKVVHLCALGIKDFVPGSLDGARPGRSRQQQLSLKQATASVHQQGGIVAAAHPGGRNGILAKLLIKRGIWEDCDVTSDVDAFQALNGRFGPSWSRARRLWIQKLRQGLRIPLLAGNDAHGDFNRYRAIGTPLVSIKEQPQRFLGHCRTGIYRSALDEGIIKAIAKGATFVTNGPAINITSGEEGQSVINTAGIQINDTGCFHVVVYSNQEFGSIGMVRVWGCEVGAAEEKPLFLRHYKPEKKLFVIDEILDFAVLGSAGYIRAESTCVLPNGFTQAFTSPCWYTKQL